MEFFFGVALKTLQLKDPKWSSCNVKKCQTKENKTQVSMSVLDNTNLNHQECK